MYNFFKGLDEHLNENYLHYDTPFRTAHNNNEVVNIKSIKKIQREKALKKEMKNDILVLEILIT